MANFKLYSRYTGGVIQVNSNGQQFLQLRSPLNLQPGNDDFYITITADLIYRPDLISYKAYNIPDLWWVIFEYNNIADPFFDLKVNSVLTIPALYRVLAAIQALRT